MQLGSADNDMEDANGQGRQGDLCRHRQLRPRPVRCPPDGKRGRFANAEPVIGRDRTRDAVAAFFTTIDGLTHHIRNVWEQYDTVIAQIEVQYRRKDGTTVTVPNADILLFDGDLVRDWQIYIDIAPVYA
jgi:ketosteroid isomerase-like protein